jgi:hypothetical protein
VANDVSPVQLRFPAVSGGIHNPVKKLLPALIKVKATKQNSQCCGSGSRRIGIHSGSMPTKRKALLGNTFSRKFQYSVQNIENYDIYDVTLTRKTKQCKRALLVNKSKENISDTLT